MRVPCVEKVQLFKQNEIAPTSKMSVRRTSDGPASHARPTNVRRTDVPRTSDGRPMPVWTSDRRSSCPPDVCRTSNGLPLDVRQNVRRTTGGRPTSGDERPTDVRRTSVLDVRRCPTDVQRTSSRRLTDVRRMSDRRPAV